MEITMDKENNILIIKLLEDIDHHSCEYIKRRSDYEINKCRAKKVIFDLEKVDFMDSSGIGMILGRYKCIIRNNGRLGLINVNTNVRRIFEMSGIFKIIDLYQNIDEAIIA